MRAKLLQPLRERSHEGHGRARRERRGAGETRPPAARTLHRPAAALSAGGADADLERARRAGGPIDQAVYTCGCGYLFSAAVTTTVVCPHCGSDQAW